jgi:replicative DNA helicase
MLSSDAAEWSVETITPSDFYTPSNGHTFAAITTLWHSGGLIDPVTVHAEMVKVGTGDVTTLADLMGLIVDVPAISHVKRYGEIILRLSLARQALYFAANAINDLQEQGNDPAATVDGLRANLAEIDSPILVRNPGDISAREFLARDLAERTPWAIPGLLRIDHRCMFVGLEGGGRSVLLRQLALCAAYGVHPFTARKIPPVKTLIVDLENPEGNVQEWINRIHEVCQRVVGNDLGLDRSRLLLRPQGIDLRKRAERAELEDVIRRHEPSLVCVGPLYKAYEPNSRESYEQAARALQDVFDSLRIRYGFALVLEHHAGNAERGVRDMRPEGSSLWRRWGELRWKLLPKADESPYRTEPIDLYPVKAMRRQGFSGDRVQHEWPDAFYWGNSFSLPWQGWYDNGEQGKYDQATPDDEPL